MIYESVFSLHELLISGTACLISLLTLALLEVNAFKTRLDSIWQHQAVKFDFTADLTSTGNRSEEVVK